MVENHHQKPKSRIDEAPIYTKKKKNKDTQPQILPRKPLLHFPQVHFGLKNDDQHHDQHDHGEDPIEGFPFDVNGHIGPDKGTQYGGYSQVNAEGKGSDPLAFEARHGHGTLDDNGDTIRPIGHSGGQSQEYQGGQGQKGTSPGHGIDETDHKTHSDQEQIVIPFKHGAKVLPMI